MAFSKGLRIFENYLRIINATVDAWPHEKRRAVLLHYCSAQVGKRKSCFRCRREAHFANASNRSAATATCRKCKKIGHYAKLCQSAQSNMCEVREIDLPEITVLYTEYSSCTPSIINIVTESTSDFWWLTLGLPYLCCPTALMHAICHVTLCCRNLKPGL